MCFEGVTYCVKKKHIEKRMNCGYTLGPCDAQQSAACINVTPDTSSYDSQCVCDGKLESLTVRYIGPSNQDLSITAKKCNVTLLDVAGATTGDVFTINASDAGLLYLRQDTYFNMVGSPFGQIKIPTNCCDNPMGRVFFPFEVIGWTDTYGNDCDDSNHAMETDGSGDEKDLTVMDVNGAMISQYPNPADDNSTFEFSVMETQNVSVSILNIRGQIVETIYSGNVEALTTYRVDYDVTDLQSGIYFVHLNTANSVLKKKFVILK